MSRFARPLAVTVFAALMAAAPARAADATKPVTEPLPEIAPPPGLWILLARIEPVFAGFELADHGVPFSLRSSTPSSTSAPGAKPIDSTVPSNGAVMACSIFIASMTINV